MDNPNLTRSLSYGLLIAVFISLGMFSCTSNVEASDTTVSDVAAAPAKTHENDAAGANADFNSFVRSFPEIQLPHEINPKEPKLNAVGETAQGLSPKGIDSFLARGNTGGIRTSGYGRFEHAGQIVLIFQTRKPGSEENAYFARTFSQDGTAKAEQLIAETRGEKNALWLVYAKLSADGKIRSHGYHNDLKTDDLLRESLACYSISDGDAFETCETPPGTGFLGLFISPEAVDGDGGHDVYRFATFIPKGEKQPKVALSRCYQNGDGQIDQCREVGIVTKEAFDGEQFKLIIDDVTGEMVPTYTITKGSSGTWALAAHWYDADSDSWIDDALESNF